MKKIASLAAVSSVALGLVCLRTPAAPSSPAHSTTPLSASTEWPLYRGPAGDGISADAIKSKPKIVWKVPTLNGFSSFTISGGGAFTQVSRNGREYAIALNAKTGEGVWGTDVDESKYQGGGDSGAAENKGGDGPRSTPVVSDGRVYVYTSGLILFCLDGRSGKIEWKHDMKAEFGGKSPTWGNAMSPVIDGDLVYIAAGGSGESFVAFNKSSGQVAWKSGSEDITHATPVIATLLGEKQIIFFVKKGLVSLSTATGKELWVYPFKWSTSTAASPVVCGEDEVYCSAGYDVGAGACKISKTSDGFQATEMFRIPGNKMIPNHWSTPVYKDGHLYGMFSFKRYGVGPLKCVEAATGKIVWEEKGFGAGNVILAGDKLVALADDGQLVIIDPTPEGYKEISRVQAITGKCWSTPAISGGKIYVRSTKEAACLDVSGK